MESTGVEQSSDAQPQKTRLFRQHWGKLLLLNWPIDKRCLRALIPHELEIDQFGGSAWISIVPFTMWRIRPPFGPPIPGLSTFHELNVRTYVSLKGEPGIWFFSLDAASMIAVWFARTFYQLPYFRASMNLSQKGETFDFTSQRIHRGAPPAEIKLQWTAEEPLPKCHPGTLTWFLTERRRFYSYHRNRVHTASVTHESWPLRNATLHSFDSSMLAPLNILPPESPPILYHCDNLPVEISRLKKMTDVTESSSILEPAVAKPASLFQKG
jgi:uncharacterized protein YqjF (DUF2071 family)